MLLWLTPVANPLQLICIHRMISLNLLQPFHRPSIANRIYCGKAVVVEIILLAPFMRKEESRARTR
jgi:hypothetical protein